MVEYQKNYNIKTSTTFGIEAFANDFVLVENEDDLVDFLTSFKSETPLLIMGGGSNMLFTKNFEGTILKPDIQGFEIISEDADFVRIRVGAGVDWDVLVEYTVEKGWSGLENLSLIPGNVGACPIQNIGAYGVEVKDTISRVEGYYIQNAEKFSFTNTQCEFGYRSSIFKSKYKNQVVISHVSFKLSKKPLFKLNYGSLEAEILQMGGVSLKNVRKSIIHTRQSKLPDPKELGNAGSFFKNPIIRVQHAEEIRNRFPQIPLFEASEGYFKVSAAFLIEKAGWKGVRIGDAGVHEKQALVLVNYGNATGNEIVKLSQQIQESVLKEFGIQLETEVNFI